MKLGIFLRLMKDQKSKNEQSGKKHKCEHASSLKISTHKIHNYSPKESINFQGTRTLTSFDMKLKECILQ